MRLELLASYHLLEMWQNPSSERLLYNLSTGLLIHILITISIFMPTDQIFISSLGFSEL